MVFVILRSEEESVKLIGGSCVHARECIEIPLFPVVLPIVSIIPLHLFFPSELIPVLSGFAVYIDFLIGLMVNHLRLTILINYL